MSSKPRILAVIPTLDDDPTETIDTIMKQTIRPERIIIAVGSKKLYEKLVASSKYKDVTISYTEPNYKEFVGKRVAVALNNSLSNVNLEEYDWLLRVDADALLPSNFVEENMKADADYVGKAGYAMLIKMKTFIKVFNGRFAEVGAEDSYIGLKLMSLGFDVRRWLLSPKLKRKSGSHHSWRYYFMRGKETYRLGYEPLHVAEHIRYDLRNIFELLGYFVALFKHDMKYDIARWVFGAQLKRLVYGKKPLQ